jgi:DNA-binding transcriptional LysR family regulator
MELRHLRAFVIVAEELHFGRAALRLHIAQPPLSQTIRALEEELGVQLFQRTSRVVSLTPAGTAFLADTRELLERLSTASAHARRVQEGEAGELVVGFMNPVMDAVLCQALAAFHQERPGVALRLRELSSTVQLEELRAGRLDVAFIRAVKGGHDLRDLETQIVAREPYVLALPSGHPLTKLGKVPLALAGAYPLILFPRTALPDLHDLMLEALRACGVEPVVSQEVLGKHASLALVAAGLGLCLVPASARDWSRRGVVLRPVEGELPLVEMRAAWLPERGGKSLQTLVRLAARNVV